MSRKPFMTWDGPKMVHFGPKIAKQGRLVNVQKWSKRVQRGPKCQPKYFWLFGKLGKKLHAQLRFGMSCLNSHLFPIGLSDTKAFPCGFHSETAEHFLLDCKLRENIRGQLYKKPEGLLKKKLSTYSEKDLSQIMLCGEKPHLPEKFYHNKSIFFSVQTFLCKSKRLLFPK